MPAIIIVIRVITVIVILLPALMVQLSVVLYIFAGLLPTLHRRNDVCPRMHVHTYGHTHTRMEAYS